jgi:hypothetical protein
MTFFALVDSTTPDTMINVVPAIMAGSMLTMAVAPVNLATTITIKVDNE